jgi:hypothetical protein
MISGNPPDCLRGRNAGLQSGQGARIRLFGMPIQRRHDAAKKRVERSTDDGNVMVDARWYQAILGNKRWAKYRKNRTTQLTEKTKAGIRHRDEESVMLVNRGMRWRGIPHVSLGSFGFESCPAVTFAHVLGRSSSSVSTAAVDCIRLNRAKQTVASHVSPFSGLSR